MSASPWNRAYLVLGSNIDPENNLRRAVAALKDFGRIAVLSRVWETSPLGFADQPNFLNAAVLLETPLSAAQLRLETIAEIERSLNRTRDPDNVNGPRTIDIDIALFNDETLQIGHRHIPDPEILTRPFLAVPLAELDPAYLHPQTGTTLAEIAAALSGEAAKMLLREDVVLDEPSGLS